MSYCLTVACSGEQESLHVKTFSQSEFMSLVSYAHGTFYFKISSLPNWDVTRGASLSVKLEQCQPQRHTFRQETLLVPPHCYGIQVLQDGTTTVVMEENEEHGQFFTVRYICLPMNGFAAGYHTMWQECTKKRKRVREHNKEVALELHQKRLRPLLQQKEKLLDEIKQIQKHIASIQKNEDTMEERKKYMLSSKSVMHITFIFRDPPCGNCTTEYFAPIALYFRNISIADIFRSMNDVEYTPADFQDKNVSEERKRNIFIIDSLFFNGSIIAKKSCIPNDPFYNLETIRDINKNLLHHFEEMDKTVLFHNIATHQLSIMQTTATIFSNIE